ncbi:MAG: riboflavin biosynthesis protein RibF [Lachnospiraceae bacterium]|nr:riboflavin biosynthesis protein RibF [Lachnospiraceae bacterium]
MIVFHGIDEYEAFFASKGSEKPGTAVAIGKFDGIHLGHKRLIESLKKRGEELKLKTLIFTFDKPFSSYFSGERAELLTTDYEREEAVREWEIDYLLEYPLRKDTVNVTPEDFVNRILVEGLNARFICGGPDMSFGRGGRGNIGSLREMAAGRYDVLAVEKVKLKDETVSSTLVRDKLKAGDMESVTALLDRPYSISGKVTYGKRLGKKILDMPTVNIVPEESKLLPPFGVYFSETYLGSERLMSITNIGIKPTVQDSGRVNAETFLYDFDDDLYGENLRVELLHFHRKEMKFDSMDTLKKTMHNDMLSGREYFAAKGIVNGG